MFQLNPLWRPEISHQEHGVLIRNTVRQNEARQMTSVLVQSREDRGLLFRPSN